MRKTLDRILQHLQEDIDSGISEKHEEWDKGYIAACVHYIEELEELKEKLNEKFEEKSGKTRILHEGTTGKYQ